MPGSEISFFQRYAQRENHVTNNTALLLRHIYQSSPFKLQGILRELVEADVLNVGPTFIQQESTGTSIPDASITQMGWRIIIETKREPHLDEDQIARHLSGVRARKEEQVFVIGLTTTVDRHLALQLAQKAKLSGVAFAWRSFADLRDIISRHCEPHETTLREVIDDYIDFLNSEGLLERPDDRIYVVPCGRSYSENERFGAYYHPPSRSYRPSKYIGIARDRRISLLGEVKATVVCNYEGDELLTRVESGHFTEEDKNRVCAMIEATAYYNLRIDTRFFVTGGFEPTSIIKTSIGGIVGPRYLSVSELIKDTVKPATSLSDLASLLNNTTFE